MQIKTQRQRILDILDRDGEISRNQCLSLFIARLAARIDDLEAEGYVFETRHRGGDYVYKVVARPKAEQKALAI